MAEKRVKRSEWTVWEFGEEEFKRLLGITGPESVLQVSVSFSEQKVSVTLSTS